MNLLTTESGMNSGKALARQFSSAKKRAFAARLKGLGTREAGPSVLHYDGAKSKGNKYLLDALFGAVFESAPVGMALTTYSGDVLALNRRLRAMAGFREHESWSNGAESFYADPTERGRLLRELKRSGRVEGHLSRLRRKDGSTMLGLLQIQEIRLGRKQYKAVNNAVRHSGARNLWVTLRSSGRGLCLQVRDDGLGLPANLAAGNGLGLQTMKYRASVVGADFTVKYGKIRGTIVTWRLPSIAPANLGSGL